MARLEGTIMIKLQF